MLPVWRKNYQRYKSYFSSIISKYKNRDDIKNYIEIVLSLITVAIFSLFALRPTLLTIAELLKQIDQNSKLIQEMDKKIKNITRAQVLNDRERTKIEILSKLIPNEINPEIIIKQIEELSKKNEVSISTINIGSGSVLGSITPITSKESVQLILPQNATNNVHYFEVKIAALSSISGYQNLLSFISDMEKQRLPIIITQTNISIIKNKDEKNLSLTLNLYLPFLENKRVFN